MVVVVRRLVWGLGGELSIGEVDIASCADVGWKHTVTALFKHLVFLPGRQSTNGFLALAQTLLI